MSKKKIIILIILIIIGISLLIFLEDNSSVNELISETESQDLLLKGKELCGKELDAYEYSGCFLNQINQCVDQEGNIYFRALSCFDVPYHIYNAKGKFVMRCGGYPGILGEKQEKKCNEFESKLECNCDKDICN